MDTDNEELYADWLARFPLLQRFKRGRKLLRQIGPVILGIELEKYLSTQYRPQFVALNLLSGFVGFSISRTLRTERNSQWSIHYRHHSRDHAPATAEMRSRFPILTEAAPLPLHLIDLYQEEVQCCLSEFSSPLAVWISLVQFAIHFGRTEIAASETVKLRKYVETLDGLSRPDDIDLILNRELNVSQTDLQQRIARNQQKLGWKAFPGNSIS